jgi:hypothetical protein
MKRELFTILSAVSLVLCVASVAMWVRSYFSADSINYSRPNVGTTSLVSSRGEIVTSDCPLESFPRFTVLFGRGS